MEQHTNSQHEKISEVIRNAWQEGHGGSVERAYIFQGEDGLVLMIPKALYQAELNLLRVYSSGASLLYRYLRSLLETVASDLSMEIEAITEKTISEVIPLVDLNAGWAIIFYRLKD
jgi:hypothetical protein